MINARTEHTATLLPNGMVLVAGGFGPTGPLASVEVYDPTTGQWTVGASLKIPRARHTATLVPPNTVVIAGGLSRSLPLVTLASTEVIMPPVNVNATIQWDPVSDPTVQGYRIHYGTTPRGYGESIDVGSGTNYAFSTLRSGTTYFFAVTAYSVSGESCFSDGVSAIAR
jgi:hypothetical protein